MNIKAPSVLVDLNTNSIKFLDKDNKVIPLKNYFEYYEVIEPSLVIYTKRNNRNLYSRRILGYSLKGDKMILGKKHIERKLTLEEMVMMKPLYY